MTKKTAPEELNLADAAGLLKVSERTLRSYIKLKKIRAVKVGGCWYVDRGSLDAFAQQPEASGLSALSGLSGLSGVSGLAEGGATTNQAASPEAQPGKSSRARPKRPAGDHAAAAIHDLACYRLFLAARALFDLRGEDAALTQFLNSSCHEVVASLGGGYYAFGHAKRSQYEKARATIGGIIGVLAADPATYQRQQKAAQFLERDVLPAFGSLMRKLERRGSDPHRKSGGSAQVSDRVP